MSGSFRVQVVALRGRPKKAGGQYPDIASIEKNWHQATDVREIIRSTVLLFQQYVRL